MLCMTGLALHAKKTVFETAAFQILIELPTNVVRQYSALGCPLHLEVGIVLFDKPIEKRLLRTVTVNIRNRMRFIPSNGNKICQVLANQQRDFTYNASMRAFLDELRRRKVHRVAIAYLVGAWLVLQTSDIILPAMGLPVRSISLVLGFLVLGFPLTLVLSWFLISRRAESN
jgi:hypothetical protein